MILITKLENYWETQAKKLETEAPHNYSESKQGPELLKQPPMNQSFFLIRLLQRRFNCGKMEFEKLRGTQPFHNISWVNFLLSSISY